MQINNNNQGWLKKASAFFGSQAVSMFGSSLVQFAIIWYVAKETNSGVNVAISTLCSFLPQAILAFFAGVWADRYNRKTLIITADLIIALSTLVLAIMMMFGYTDLWMIFLVSAIRSAGSGVQAPTVNAVIPQIVPEDKLLKVNGINGSIHSLVNLLSPAAGGAILTYGLFHNVLLIDVVTAIIGVSILFFIHIPIHKKALETVKPDYFVDLRGGIKYTFTHSFVARLLIIYIVFSILLVPAIFLNVLFVTRAFGDSYWNLTLNEISFFVGAALGGVLIGTLKVLKNRLHILFLGCVIFGLLTFWVGFINIFWLYLIVMFLTGITVPLFNAPIMSLLQEKVESDMHGRVFSLLQITSTVTMMIGMSVFGPLADRIDIRWLMIGSGALLTVLSVCMLGYKSFLREGLPANKDGNDMANN